MFSKFLTTLMTGLVLCASTLFAEPQDGQIAVDPDNSARMVYWNEWVQINDETRMKPCLFAGPGDPEDFFYNNTSGNKSFLINRESRCTYITAYLEDFGGGDPGSGTTLDNTLNEWDSHITDLQNAGIIVVFFLFDDSKSRPSDWQDAVDKMVDKFKDHKLFIWSVAEEYQEALSSSDVSEVAARIKAQDPYDHVVGVHQLSSTSFDFNSDSNLEMFAIQNNTNSSSAVHSGLVSAWNNTSGNKILNLAEIADHAKKDRTTVRKWNWAAVMGGASAIQVLWMGRQSDPSNWNEQEKYDDCAVLMDFFEQTDVNDLVPRDDLTAEGTDWVLAREGQSYIAYADGLSGDIGLESMDAGDFDLTWLDIPSGNTVEESQTVSAGTNSFSKPGGIGSELAVWIRKAGQSEPAYLADAVISPVTAEILANENTTFTAQGKDQYGQNFSATFDWTVSGGGSMSSGTFTSNGSEGTFTVTATAQSDAAISATAEVSVVSSYPAPVATDQSVETTEGNDAAVSLSYSSGSPGPFTFTIVSDPSHGSVTNTGNDATYTPASGYTGSDSFTWKVTDQASGLESNTATVSVTVTAASQDWISYGVEAEDYDNLTGGWVEETSTGGYSGGGYMKNTGSGEMDYIVTFPEAGTYYLYIRSYATNGENNGCHLDLDGTALTGNGSIDAVYFVKTSTWNWPSQWQYPGEGSHSGPLDISISSAGEHTITIKNRDQGLKVDRLMITRDKVVLDSYNGFSSYPELDVMNDYPNGYDVPTTIRERSASLKGSTGRGSLRVTALRSSLTVVSRDAGTVEVFDLLGNRLGGSYLAAGNGLTIPRIQTGTYLVRMKGEQGMENRKVIIR